MDSFASGFAGVDAAGDSRSFVHYLDLIHSLPFFQDCKQESYRRLGIRPGASVLEIGCGNGVDATILAGMAGPDGQVVGIDVSTTMLAAARTRCGTAPGSPGYLLCDAGALAFPEGTFTAVRADRVIQHTKDPSAVVREMARVTRCGGTVVAFEPDWETFVLSPGERETTRKILNFWCDRIPSGWVGRSLPGAFAAAGLEEITVEPVTLVLTDRAVAERVFDLDTTRTLAAEAGVISAKEAENWEQHQLWADAAGQFFSSLTFYLVTGKKEER